MFAYLFDWAAGLSLIEFGLTWWLQSAVLIAIGLATANLIRRFGPARQSAVYRSTLIAVLICPLLTGVMAQLGVQIVSIDLQSSLSGPEMAQAPVTTLSRFEPESSEMHTSTPMMVPADPFGPVSATSIPIDEAFVEPIVDMTPPASTSLPAVEENLESSPSATMNALLYLAIACWILGVTILATRLAQDLLGSCQLRGQSGDAGESAQMVCRDVAERLEVRQPQVRVTPFLSSPCLFGHWNPTVFLPEATPESSYREVFLHELAHLRRGDWLWNVIGRGARALLWMQPLMWLLSRRTSIVAEEVCDDYVLEHGGNREDYVQRLVEIAESRLPPRAVSGVTMVSFKSTLTQRARRILDNTRELSTTVGHRFAAMALIAMLVTTASVGLFDVGGPEAAAQQADDSPVEETAEEASTSPPADPFGGGSNPEDAVATQQEEESVALIEGRVLGPNGEPFAGANLVLERNQLHITPRGLKPVIEIIDQTTSATDGTFRLDPGQHGRIGKTQIVASAQGFGVSVDLSFKENTSPTIQLVNDVPVEGRLVDTEGQPLSGITVTVLTATPGKGESEVTNWIKERRPELFKAGRRGMGFFYGNDPVFKTVFPGLGEVHQDSVAMPNHETTTDQDGRFRLAGFGHNRKLLLRFAGETIATDHALVVTRDMTPFKAYDDSKSRLGFLDYTHHGATCNIVARPAQSIIGRLVDAETDKPLAGALVAIRSYAGGGIGSQRGFVFADADANGVFQFDGVPAGGGHELSFLPTDESPYFPTDLELPRTDAPGPIECEMRLSKAKWIKGRVTNQDGEPVKAIMQYYPYRSNSAAERYPNYDPIITGSAPNSNLKTDDDGKFRIRAIEGAGVIGARVDDHEQAVTYLSDVPQDLIERMGGKRMGKVYTPWTYTWFHVMRDVEIPSDVEQIDFDLTVQQGQRHSFTLEGPDGVPIQGAEILGRVFPPKLEKLEDANVEVTGMSQDDRRLVVVFHKDRRLGKALVVTAEDRPTRVRLEPCATLKGRLIDGDGEPVSEVDVRVTPLQDRDSWSRIVSTVETTDDGRFEVLLPAGNAYRVWHYDNRGPNFGVRLTPKTGVNYDVGDLKDGDELDETETSKRLKLGVRSRAPMTLVAQRPSKPSPYVYEGKVLASDGRPASGARIYHVYRRQSPSGASKVQPVAETDAEGRFRFESDTAAADDYFGGLILVKLDGHALAWSAATALEKTGRLREQFKRKPAYPRFAKLLADDQGPLRLRADDVTVTGQLVDLEGNGVEDAIVSVESLSTGADGTLDEWERVAAGAGGHVPALQNTILRTIAGPEVNAMFPTIKTDRDGRFEIKGIGKDRIAKLVIRGKNIEAILAFARTNNGPKRDIGFSAQSAEYWKRHYYGTNLRLVASPAKPIVGRITDAATGEPLQGVVLTSMESYSQQATGNRIAYTRVGSREVIARTDADGNYRLDGLPAARGTPVLATLESKGYPPREFRVDTRGVGVSPVEQHLKLHRGIRVSGRVTNANTGKGISGSFRYLPKPTEKVSEHSLHRSVGQAGTDGEFSCLVPRDGGHLCFRAFDSIAYPMVATPDSQRTRLVVFSVGREFNFVKSIQAGPEQESLRLEFSLTPLPTLSGTAVGPDGSRLTDLQFVGRSPQFSRWTPSTSGEIEVIRIEKGQTRKVAVYQRSKSLAGMMVMDSGAAKEFTIETRPWATLTGRLVDEDGEPIAGAKIYSSTRNTESFASPRDAMMKHDFSRSPLPLPPSDDLGNRNHHTDQNGRFELVGMIPEYAYNLDAMVPSSLQRLDTRLADGVTLTPGEQRNLGDVVLREPPTK